MLEAARRMLEATPAHEISMRELARAAGVSHAAPSKHFNDRAGFLAALAARCMAEFVDEQRSAVDAVATAGDRLVELGAAYVAYGAGHPHAFQLIFDPTVSPPGRPPDELAPLIETHASMLHRAVADALAAGALVATAPAPTVAMGLWSQVHGLTHLVIGGHIPRPTSARSSTR